MSLITRQRLFICLVALLNLSLAAGLTLQGHAGAPLGVIGGALLPLAWLAGRRPDTAAVSAREGDAHAA
jgi:hypothetical protein